MMTRMTMTMTMTMTQKRLTDADTATALPSSSSTVCLLSLSLSLSSLLSRGQFFRLTSLHRPRLSLLLLLPPPPLSPLSSLLVSLFIEDLSSIFSTNYEF